MTLEEVNNKIKFFNDGLDRFISECQLNDNFDEKRLTTMSTAIDRIILQDRRVKDILQNGKPEDISKYTEAIKSGMEKAKKLIEDYGITQTGKTKTKISKIADKSNEKTSKTLTGLEKIDNNDLGVIDTNEDRSKDLKQKIVKAKVGMHMMDKFSKVRNALKAEGRLTTAAEAIKEAKSVKGAFEIFKLDSKTIREMEVINLPELLKKYNAMSKDAKFDIAHKDAQDILERIKDAADKLSIIDDLDVHNATLDLNLNIPTDLKDKVRVETWIKKINDKLSNPDERKKLDPSLPDYKKFLESRKQLIRKTFILRLEDSPVYKNLYDGDFKDKANLKFDPKEMEKYLDDTIASLEAFKSVERKDKSDLIRYVADAEKLLKSYEVTCSSPNSITINGKTRTFSDDIDMTDENKAKDALAEIKALPKNDEFRKEVEGEAKALAGVRPTDKWYHRVLSFITFRKYMTPEDKYFVNLEMKKREVVTNLIKDNKEQRDEAKKDVDNDKGIFKKIAREFVIKNHKSDIGKTDKEKIHDKREKSEPLTR